MDGLILTVKEGKTLEVTDLLNKIDVERIWDKEPVFCFTSDIDWASETAIDMCLSDLCSFDLKPTVFVTHKSKKVEEYKEKGLIHRGIHPNFLPGSSQGAGFQTVIETCMKFAPEAKGFRSHRLFDVTDITHMLHEKYGFKYVSNLGTIMQTNIKPVLHESGLIHFPIFFEDGTHLFNNLELDLSKYMQKFLSPGIKIIVIHPMNYVINPPTLKYMRDIKDSLSRDEYNKLSNEEINKLRFNGLGINNLAKEIISLAKEHKIMYLDELYNLTISEVEVKR